MLVLGGIIWTMFVAKNVVPNTSIKDWARDEATERMRRRELGLPVKYGYNYAVLRSLGQETDDQDEE